MKVIAILILCLTFSSVAQTFNDFLARINSAPDSLKMSIVDSMMNNVPAFPYLEQDSLAHFLFRGNASTITVPGDANQWNPSSFPMSLISGTNLWYRTEVFEPDARLDYKFVLNGSNWILDPLNPWQVSGGYGPNSELRMALYIPAAEIQYYNNISHGALGDTNFYSTNLGNSRTISVYLPPSFFYSSDSFPVILFHDGLEYLSLANTKNIFDYLIAQERIVPTVGVFVPPVNRTEEYAGNLKTEFSQFIVTEVMPWVDRKFRTRRDPMYRATLGASNGGNIALWLGLNYPQAFGKIAAQSSYVESSISYGFQNGPPLNTRFYLDIGTYDIPVLITLVDDFIQILHDRGYPYQYRIYHEGHSWGNWRAHVDNALEMFFPGNSLSIDQPLERLPHFSLSPNYPNPFNSSTTIHFELYRPAEIKIAIYDIQGQLIRMLRQGWEKSGNHFLSWDGRNDQLQPVSSGIYLLVLHAENQQISRKMIFLQ
jgi:enterochelin esterase-like enzyme